MKERVAFQVGLQSEGAELRPRRPKACERRFAFERKHFHMTTTGLPATKAHIWHRVSQRQCFLIKRC